MNGVLVIDDDDRFRARLCRAIGERGYEVAGAANGAVARGLAASCRRAVLDLRLGSESGLELLDDLLETNGDLEVVVLTGYGSIATAVEALRRGAVNYITKPADADRILAAFEPEGATELEALPVPSLDEVEWEHIQRVMHECGGNVSHAARLLGVHRRSLQRKLGKLPLRG